MKRILTYIICSMLLSPPARGRGLKLILGQGVNPASGRPPRGGVD